MNGYDTYDYGARGYHAAVGRFSTIDPLAERYYNVSPYAYCANNPISHIDPTGMDSTYYNSKGNVIYSCGNDPNTNNSYVIKTTQTTDEMYYETQDDPENGNSNPIAKDQANGSIDLVSNGNLIGDQMDDFVEIPNPTTGANIFNSIPDDGTGGTAPKNNMEYAMNTNAGEVTFFITGKVGNPDETGSNVSVDRRENHDHPSGVGEKGGKWRQPPSKTDITNMSSGYNKNVWGMRSEIVYVINSVGVIATIPMKIYKKWNYINITLSMSFLF